MSIWTLRLGLFILGVLIMRPLGVAASDGVHLQNPDGSLGADAIVVGLRFDGGRRAIAARFVTEVRNWIIQG